MISTINSLIVGAICGLGPIILGTIKKQMTLGICGLFACILSGLVLSIFLAGPMCVFFIWLITKKYNT